MSWPLFSLATYFLHANATGSPLLPGACHSTELKLLALVPGALHLEAVRLVDMNTNETTDIRDLPDIVAFNRQHISEEVMGDS